MMRLGSWRNEQSSWTLHASGLLEPRRADKTFRSSIEHRTAESMGAASKPHPGLGCGYGRALGILNANGYRDLIGVDPAAAMITAARQALPSISFEVLDDYRKTGLPDASVDAVLLFAVLTLFRQTKGSAPSLQKSRVSSGRRACCISATCGSRRTRAISKGTSKAKRNTASMGSSTYLKA